MGRIANPAYIIYMATLQIILVILAGAIMFGWLAYALTGSRTHESPEVLHVLRYGSVLRTSALILALSPPMLMAWFVWTLQWRTTTSLALAGAAYLVGCAITGVLLLEAEGVQYVLTDEGMTRFTRWAKPVTLKWTDVEWIEYSALHRCFVVVAGSQSLKVSRYLVGIAAFVELARQKIGRERCMSAAAAMDAVN